MSRNRRLFAALALFGVGFEGFISAHALAYHFVVRGPVERAALLAGTNHFYLGRVGLMAVVSFVLAAFATFALEMNRASTDGLSAKEMFLRVAPIQVGSYLILESIERLPSSAMNQRWLTPLLLVGLVLQLGAAALAVVVVRVVGLLGRAVAAAIARDVPREATPHQPFALRIAELSSIDFASAHGARAPPFSFSY